MADGCKVTAGAGGGKGLEMALGSSIKGQLQGWQFKLFSFVQMINISVLIQIAKAICPTTSRRDACSASTPAWPKT